MSSRHRRSQTLKRFDKLYRNGRLPSAPTFTNKLGTTPLSEEEGTLTGFAQFAPGIEEALNSGPARPPSTARRVTSVNWVDYSRMWERYASVESRVEEHRRRMAEEQRRMLLEGLRERAPWEG